MTELYSEKVSVCTFFSASHMISFGRQTLHCEGGRGVMMRTEEEVNVAVRAGNTWAGVLQLAGGVC